MNKINFQAWALYENFDIFTAAALWCERSPYDCEKWSNWEYIEVRNLVLHLFRHQADAENYPEYKRNQVILILGERLDAGLFECIEQCKKIILTRSQLKAIAHKVGVKPEFLFGHCVDSDNVKISEENDFVAELPGQNRDIDRWLYETWMEHDKPGGAKFFTLLKRYKGKNGSPIIDHFPSGEKPGIKWKTANSEGILSKKAIQNIVSGKFKKMDVNL